jgi:hypothetical protein
MRPESRGDCSFLAAKKAFNRTAATPGAGVERAAIDRVNARALFPRFGGSHI